MKRDELEAKGLTKEQIDFVMQLNGEDINLEKAKTKAANEQLKAANET